MAAANSDQQAGLEHQVQALTRELRQVQLEQKATGEVLKLISGTKFELNTVLLRVIESATRLCDAAHGFIFRQTEGGYCLAAAYGVLKAFEEWRADAPIRPSDGSMVGRVIATGSPQQVLDAQADPRWRLAHANAPGMTEVRSLLGVPMQREGALIGVVVLWRASVRPFSDSEVELVQTFANQAVIAIENVRLLGELHGRNFELTEALAQQTATSEVLKVISASPTEVHPVFDTMAERAMRLCNATVCGVYRLDDGVLDIRALANVDPVAAAKLREAFPSRADRSTAAGRAAMTGQIVQLADVLADREYGMGEKAANAGFRSVLAVPLLENGVPIGVVAIGRDVPGEFSDRQIQLLRIFADQGVVAIANVRLFNEIQQKTRQLEQSKLELEQWNRTLETRVAEAVAQLERAARLKRFLSPQLAERILAGGADDPLASHRREICVVFLDLRGFTSFTEMADPEDVMLMLREYHAAMGKLVLEYEGTLERFTGDGMMVIFNDPTPIPDAAHRAAGMAIAMQREFGRVAEGWRPRGYDLQLGIGIGQGYATIGGIGFEGRLDYSAIGTVCNLAARLCGEAKGGEILIAQRVNGTLGGTLASEPAGQLVLKGFHHPIPAWRLLAS